MTSDREEERKAWGEGKREMPRSVVQVIAVMLLGLVGVMQGASQATDRKLTLKDKLASGKRGGGTYLHPHPSFRLSIPETIQGEWYFMVFDNQAIPFYIVKPSSTENGMPFISSAVDQIPPALHTLKPEDLFKDIVADAMAWEAGVLGVFQVINPGEQFAVSGYPAYERSFRIITAKAAVHIVYIIYENHVIQLGLNSGQENFHRDDEIFMEIVKTFAGGV